MDLLLLPIYYPLKKITPGQSNDRIKTGRFVISLRVLDEHFSEEKVGLHDFRFPAVGTK